ncbi:MAG: MoaD/ThiS family protein [Candidatus Brockarchaeota archaeon]|nr:MoaD/ThiS family protein [Candidatus Brockarchaeota archaeon]MBO3808397.1 MoaD/ThiS family protein [Candidatus Brockarchaeota archaeon]
MMRIEVKYYAWIREKVGEKETLEVDEGTTVGKIVEKLRGRHADLAGENFLIAVNGRTVDLNTCLNEGDVVAVFPPAGGG